MLSKRAGKGERLDHSIRQKYEKRFGVDLGHVRIYTGEFAEEFNRQRGAYAVTVGATGMILMGGSPEKSMASAAGQALLAHELTHAAQAQKSLSRAARSPDMEFAEEHEAEAEAVEQEVHAEEQGGAKAAPSDQGKEKAADDLREQVLARVLDMLADAGRVHLWRGGPASRRP